MTLKFLSAEWFERVMSLRAEAESSLGEAGVPVELRGVRLNLRVPHPEGEKQFALADGDARLGHVADAQATLTVEYDVARQLFLEGDASAAMQAFMAGQIRVEGDMSKLLLLQQYMGATPSAGQLALRDKVIAFTVV